MLSMEEAGAATGAPAGTSCVDEVTTATVAPALWQRPYISPLIRTVLTVRTERFRRSDRAR